MEFMIDHPRVLSIATTVLMWLTAVLGVWLRRRFHSESADDKDSYGFVVTATLTLLGLIIGFTFSMAATRYDQRRLFEENEANAIGTEFVRLDLLPADVARMEKHLLRQYLDRRIDFYDLDYGAHFSAVEKSCAKLQNAMWQGLLAPVTGQPNAVTALAVSGMNDVLNSQGYTQFAWWNRIPNTSWGLMLVIALFANFLVGYAAKRSKPTSTMLLVLPLIVAVSFFLIADIDSPRGGLIRIHPQNLRSLSQSLGSEGR
jgi:hypothetical protein